MDPVVFIYRGILPWINGFYNVVLAVVFGSALMAQGVSLADGTAIIVNVINALIAFRVFLDIPETEKIEVVYGIYAPLPPAP